MKKLLKNEKLNITKLALCIFAIICFTAYTFNDSAPYLIVNCTLGNNVKIYFNTSSADNKIIYDPDTQSLINVSGSSVAGYFERNGEQFQITFPVFDIPYYRTTNNYNYVYITQVEIVKNHNVRFYRYVDDSVVMFGGVAILLFMILLKRG